MLQTFRSWGYADFIPPTLERAETIAAGSSSTLQSQLVRFADRDGAMLALRADMTIAAARLMATRLYDAPLPQRFCYAGHVFRDLEAQAGQQREFAQTGVELIGVATPEADAEVLALTAAALQAAGLRDFQLVLGQMEFFGGLLAELSLSEPEKIRLQLAVDRNSEAELDELLRTFALPPSARRTIEAFLSLSGRPPAILLAEAERLVLNQRMRAALANLRAICTILDRYAIMSAVTLDLTEIQNIGYYTGLTFEVLAPGLGFRLASGGRYDNLIGAFGRTMPAVGVAFGLERVLLALAAQNRRQPLTTPLPPDLVAGNVRDAHQVETIKRWRAEGLRIAVDLEGQSESQLLLHALTHGAPAVAYFSASGIRVTTGQGAARRTTTLPAGGDLRSALAGGQGVTL
jgi:ATP phosphoribosyltransferase regulatory subunit